MGTTNQAAWGALAIQRTFTTALTWLLVFSALILAGLGIYNLRRNSDWAVADWLINYSGGFVRRGFLGSLALFAGPFHLSPAISILVLQCALYAVILLSVWRLLDRVQWTFPLAALVFSPATLQFPLMDPNFAFRKEILFFALLSVSLLLLRNGADKAVLIALLTGGCAVCVLSHEALIVFFPYLLGALLLHLPRARQAFTWASLPGVTAGALFVAVSRHPGNAVLSSAVCSSLGGTLTDPPSGLCGGAIAYLARPAAYARGEVQRVAHAEHYSRVMPPLIALTLCPILLQLRSLWRDGRHREVCIIAAAGLTAAAASVSLFLYGTDWTRWIYIHAFSLMLLLISMAQHRQEPDSAYDPAQVGRNPLRLRLATAVLLLYIFAWNLSLYQPKLPFGGLIHFLYKAHANRPV